MSVFQNRDEATFDWLYQQFLTDRELIESNATRHDDDIKFLLSWKDSLKQSGEEVKSTRLAIFKSEKNDCLFDMFDIYSAHGQYAEAIRCLLELPWDDYKERDANNGFVTYLFDVGSTRLSLALAYREAGYCARAIQVCRQSLHANEFLVSEDRERTRSLLSEIPE